MERRLGLAHCRHSGDDYNSIAEPGYEIEDHGDQDHESQVKVELYDYKVCPAETYGPLHPKVADGASTEEQTEERGLSAPPRRLSRRDISEARAQRESLSLAAVMP